MAGVYHDPETFPLAFFHDLNPPVARMLSSSFCSSSLALFLETEVVLDERDALEDFELNGPCLALCAVKLDVDDWFSKLGLEGLAGIDGFKGDSGERAVGMIAGVL